MLEKFIQPVTGKPAETSATGGPLCHRCGKALRNVFAHGLVCTFCMNGGTPPPRPAPSAVGDYFVGLDLAQRSDFTALAVLHRRPYGQGAEPEYQIRTL